jgi:hypothetical protein
MSALVGLLTVLAMPAAMAADILSVPDFEKVGGLPMRRTSWWRW